MNWFTWSLIVLAGIALLVIVFHEVRTWRKPGKLIGQNAAMDSDGVNSARLQHNISTTRPGGNNLGSGGVSGP